MGSVEFRRVLGGRLVQYRESVEAWIFEMCAHLGFRTLG